MDEDYARKLRAWLSAEPEATPRGAEEEREWLREVPAPAPDGGWTPDDRPPGQARAADERLPAPASDERWTVRGRLPREPVEELEEEWVCPVIALPVPRVSEENGCRMSGADERRSRNRRLPGDRLGASETAERSRRLPGEAATAQPGASETSDRRPQIWRGEAPATPPGMSEAEARSRWNHPSNWHRRRRAEGQQRDPDQPGSH
ncbi:hypothetical protein [Amycolatopsis sp. MEPSY49]|uniref:hypothetical protein n=1 Tax=Amycolatopsis sp. MEPSY49 TaxID=3151600 RepID=UPI003EF8A173